MKKIIISITVASLLNLAGCFSMTEISKEEFISRENKDAALLLTNKMESYQLEQGLYIIKADTIYGKGSKLLDDGTKQPISGSIPLNDVIVFNVEETDLLGTILLTLGVAVITVFFGLMIYGGIND